ncbi:hypothetical protein E3P99_02966 [Wallemia hederae]|uniref:Uncharacterized protein n=1 Tax=Wallemia hederae TaxID=1540922 RepID=A0A4T0FI18_9BASI|nr:hypothetical protein E3P99_02966 [Wallemia hederae]
MSRQPISYSDVAPVEIPETALPDPNFVAELRDSKGSNKHRKHGKRQRKRVHKETEKEDDLMTQYYDEIDAGQGEGEGVGEGEEGNEQEYDDDDDDDDEESFAEAALIDGDLSVWDDSVLMDAWDAANEEYRLLHGDKSWKSDPDMQLEMPSMIWYDSSTDLGKIAAKQVATANKNKAKEATNSASTSHANKRKRTDSVDARDDAREQIDTAAAAAAVPASASNTQINTGDAGKDYVLHQLSQAWYSAGYWTGVLHEKYGETGQHK